MSRSEFRQVSYGSIWDRYEIDLNTRIRTEIDLNESEIDLNETEIDLNESEIDLNESEIDLNESEIDLNESEIDLNESEIDLNESEIDLNESEIDLNECEHFLKGNLDAYTAQHLKCTHTWTDLKSDRFPSTSASGGWNRS